MNTKIFRDRLYNFILPLVFFEWWYVLLALIFVVLVEVFVVKLFIKEKFRRLLALLFKANLITTLLGFLFQGIIRVILAIIIFITTGQDFDSYPVIQGILGNVAISKNHGKFEIDSIAEISTSMIICLVLSVIIENRAIRDGLQDAHNRNTIFRSVLTANIISYLLLTAFVFYKL